MRKLASVFLAFGLYGQTGDVRNPHTSASDVAAGAKTFRSHCAECHGIKGEGGRGPDLTAGHFFHGSSDGELLRNISEGIPGTEMPGLFYSPDRVWQVVAYLRSLSQLSGTAIRGNPTKGETLFRSAGCLGCHRVAGNGQRMGPDLTLIGSTRSLQHLKQAVTDPGADVRQRYWVVELTTDAGNNANGFLMNEDTYNVQFIDFSGQLRSFAKSGLKDLRVLKTSKMPSFKERFPQEDIDHLVAFLSSLRPGRSEK